MCRGWVKLRYNPDAFVQPLRPALSWQGVLHDIAFCNTVSSFSQFCDHLERTGAGRLHLFPETPERPWHHHGLSTCLIQGCVILAVKEKRSRPQGLPETPALFHRDPCLSSRFMPAREEVCIPIRVEPSTKEVEQGTDAGIPAIMSTVIESVEHHSQRRDTLPSTISTVSSL